MLKRTTFLLFLALCATVSAKTYYVAPTGGSDMYSGTITQPWATWQKAFNTAQAGDTVYFRGGTWYPTQTVSAGEYYASNSGTHDAPICYFNYPGEVPILDCRLFPTRSSNSGLTFTELTYIKLRGLVIQNVYQKQFNEWISAIQWTNNDPDNGVVSFENVTARNNGGFGFFIVGYDTLYLKNCDSHHNLDSISVAPGNRADGYNISNRGAEADTLTHIAYIEGCRAWSNSDDGFNIDATKQLDIKNCWAFGNGLLSNGNGIGIKFAYSELFTAKKRKVYNCITAYNKYVGYFTMNLVDTFLGPFNAFYNNVSYKDTAGFGDTRGDWVWPEDKGHEIYRNNIVYQPTSTNLYFGTQAGFSAANAGYPYHVTQDHNTWVQQGEDHYWYTTDNPAYTVTDADFISLDTAQLRWPRKADGSLPDITFMKLASTSDLIDGGVDVGLSYYGTAPDLGYSEFLSGSINIPAIPNYVNSVIENATPSRLEMFYNLTLANIVPTASAFTVTVNSSTRGVSAVAISGTKVQLTLPSPIAYGDIVTVAYTKPSSNPLQTIAGGQAASITAQIVTNNVAAISPVYVNSVVENATPSRLEMFYNLTLANIVPTASAFTVTVNSSTRGVSAVAISGTKVQLTLPSPIAYGDIVTVAYTKPFLNPLQIAAGGQAASFPAQNVTNNCIAPSANQSPSASISSPTKSTSFISPATITIDAIASDPDGTVTKVEFYNGTVKLGERTVAPYSFTWKDVTDGTYSITAVATDNQNARSTSSAVSVVVEKAAVAINQPPVVSITSPNKNKKYRKNENIVIKAEASDPDGTVSKVEFKNGNTTIAEITTAPYIYIWEDVDTGTYVITAIVTDNLGASNASSEMELKVEDFYDVNLEIINLYPNPNNGHFSIYFSSSLQNENNRVSIISLAGETVYNDIIAKEETSREFDLSDAAAGTYVLIVTSGNTIVATKKFIKK